MFPALDLLGVGSISLPRQRQITAAIMGQFEPLQNDLILRTARGNRDSSLSTPVPPLPNAKQY